MPRHPLYVLLISALPTFAQTTLEPIVVPVQQADVVIDQATLEKAPPRNVKALFDNVVNVNFSQTGHSQPGDIEIRGMGGMGSFMGVGSDRVTLEMDGMDIGQSFTFGHNMRNGRQYVDPADLKTVSVHKGPGNKGLAGHVALRSKDPEDYLLPDRNFGGEVRGSYSGDNDDFSVGVVGAGRINERHSLSLSYTRHWFDELDNKGGLDIDGSRRTRSNPQDGGSNAVNGKWVFKPDANQKMTLAVQHFDVKTDSRLLNQLGSGRIGVTHAYDNTQKNRRDALSFNHSAEISTPLFDQLEWQVSAQRISSEGKNSQDRTLASSGRRTLTRDNNEFDINTYTLRGDFSKTLGDSQGISHTLQYGGKLQYSEANQTSQNITATATRNSVYFPKNEQWQGTIHAADHIRFADSGFSLEPSLNLTHIRITPKVEGATPVEGTRKYSKTALGGGLRGEWQINENHQLSAAYNHATRMPAYGETNGQSYGHWLGRPNPDLKPETSDGIELSWRGQGNLGQAQTTLFYNRYSNMINFDCGPNYSAETCTVYNESGRSKTYGVEVEGKLALSAFGLADGLALEGAAAYTKGKDNEGNPLLRVEPLHGHIGLRYDAPQETWGANGRLRFAAAKKAKDIPADSGSALPGYGVVDLTGYYQPVTNLTISGGLYNLLDKKYAKWNRARGYSGDFTPYSEAGRYVGVNIRYRF